MTGQAIESEIDVHKSVDIGVNHSKMMSGSHEGPPSILKVHEKECN
jgi:hypothetical protein